MTRLAVFLAIMTAALWLLMGARAQAPTSELGGRCNALASTDFSKIPDAPTQITDAKFADPSGDMPASCQATGYVAPSIGFAVGLPENWNGKFMEVGCGGHCGRVLATECNSAIRRGYACVATDMGHKGSGVDGLWAYESLQAKIDWGYRATHVVALAGKAVTEHYYARALRKSYFLGCSTGGRQGL
jgi:feruloyl esterase